MAFLCYLSRVFLPRNFFVNTVKGRCSQKISMKQFLLQSLSGQIDLQYFCHTRGFWYNSVIPFRSNNPHRYYFLIESLESFCFCQIFSQSVPRFFSSVKLSLPVIENCILKNLYVCCFREKHKERNLPFMEIPLFSQGMKMPLWLLQIQQFISFKEPVLQPCGSPSLNFVFNFSP